MTIYSVHSQTADDNEIDYVRTHFTLTSAKKEMKRLISRGYSDTIGDKTKIYSNGDWEPCGEISLTKSNKSFIANTRMTKSNY